MNTGIYRLVFKGTHKVYVGQAENIEYRYTRHIKALKDGSSSVKLMEAYRLYGTPSIEILCLCSLEELDKYENEAIDIFNAVADGFNTYDASRGRSSNCGIWTSNSKFTEEQIEKVFFMLLDPVTPFKVIEIDTGVPIGSINMLAQGLTHKELQDKFPNEYAKLIQLKGSRIAYSNCAKNRGIQYPVLVSPEGTEYSNISNVKQFALEHDLKYDGLHRLLRKTRGNSYKGWTTRD